MQTLLSQLYFNYCEINASQSGVSIILEVEHPTEKTDSLWVLKQRSRTFGSRTVPRHLATFAFVEERVVEEGAMCAAPLQAFVGIRSGLIH